MESSNKKKQIRKNICVVCGKEFKASGNCKYCSPECKSKQKERNLHTITCKNCGKTAEVYKNAKFCSDKCRIYYKNRQAALRKQNKRNTELNGVENIDYVVCQICGMKAKQLGDAHFKVFHNTSISKYKQLYPNAKITSQMFIDRNLLGNNNPGSVENTTLQERMERSPFSKEFYRKRNIDESERDNFIKTVVYNRQYNTRLSYYIKRGYNIEYAKDLLSERQRTFTLEKCIKKYGETEGKIKFEERQRNWAKVMKEKYERGEYSKIPKNANSITYSNVEAECILKIVHALQLNNNEYYAVTSNKKQLQLYVKGLHRWFNYDFAYNNKIIEFNGNYWHCNPAIYESDYYNPLLKMTAKEKWQFDKLKNQIAENAGYTVLVIWELDYKKDPKGTVQKCIDFLNDKV